MNILPKKNWHVLKKENIFKVKADIAKAKALEDEGLRKSDISNQETYLSILRNKSKSNNYNSIVRTKEDIHNSSSDPLHLLIPQTNIEHEVEKKETQEKLEKNIGLLTYLGQSVIDSRDKDELWWIKGDKKSTAQLTEEKKRKQDLLLKKDDPLETILFHQNSIDQYKLARSAMVPKSKSFPKEDFIQKTKKSKKSKKKRHRSSSSDSNEEVKSKKRKKDKEMHKLRKERREREKLEKYRAEMIQGKSYNGRLFPI